MKNIVRADNMIRESVSLVFPDKHEEWNHHHQIGSGLCQEELRFCGDRNYEMFLLLNIIWSQPADPLNEDYDLIRMFNDVLPTSFDDEVFSIKQNELDYDELIQASSTHITKSNPKFNVIVPVKNRKDHLFAFLSAMNFVLSGKDDWCVTVIFQEETDELFCDVCSRQYNFNLNCIYLPHTLIREKYADNMNRSLCYNLVSKMVECEWQINHDVDLIFLPDFCVNVENKAESNVPWFQPYRGSRVVYLTETVSASVMESLKVNEPPTIECHIPPLNNTPHSSGAPGGSVVVRHKTFMEIGGYDPEFVWGYAPEDAIFWRKLEYHFSDDLSICGGSACIHPFIRDDVFSHETNVELFHLWHPPTQADQRYPFWSLFVSSYIINCFNENQIKKWLRLSKEKLNYERV